MTGPRSLTFKLSILFATASLALIVAANTFQFYFLEQRWHAYETADLDAASEALRRIVAATGTRASLALNRDAIADRIANRRISFRIQDPKGGELVSTFAPEVSLSGTGTPHLRSLVARAVFPDGSPAIITVALDTSEHARVHGIYRSILLAMTVASVMLAALLGHFVSRRGLAALRRVSLAAREITAEKLGERLPVSQLPLELRDVAESFNAMLARLQQSFRRMEDFAANLAHELRTPVNNLLGETHVALGRLRSVDEYRAILESNSEELERLTRMVEGLLFLARADDRRLDVSREPVELDASVRKIIDYYEGLLDEKGITLIRQGTASARADRLLIERVLHNLVSNAVRHTPAGGQISIDLWSRPDGSATVHVTNSGPDIPAAERERVFERFYRTDSSRSGADAGVGLGLAIARSVMELHGGTISVGSVGGGTRFTLTFPGSGSANHRAAPSA